MNRYQVLFTSLAEKKQGAFIPFVMLGDPSPEESLKIIDCLVENGADALELGLPFSDPLADGETIQAAALRAFQSNTTIATCFQLIKHIRSQYPTLPIGILLYANLVYRAGIENFYKKAKSSGVDSILIADIPLLESAPYRDAAQQNELEQVFICPPNADDSLLRQLASYGRGYLYMIARTGVTSADNRSSPPAATFIQTLKSYHSVPLVQGFGISTPEQVKESLKAGCQGVISGSAVVKIIEQYHQEPKKLFAELGQFIQRMKAATFI